MLSTLASLIPAGLCNFSSRGVVHVEQAVYVVVRAEAIRQVTGREYAVREASQRLGVGTYNLAPRGVPLPGM